MEAIKIEEIKKYGMKNAIEDKIKSLTWEAKILIEESRNDGMKNFGAKIDSAKILISDAEQLHAELYKI